MGSTGLARAGVGAWQGKSRASKRRGNSRECALINVHPADLLHATVQPWRQSCRLPLMGWGLGARWASGAHQQKKRRGRGASKGAVLLPGFEQGLLRYTAETLSYHYESVVLSYTHA